MAQDLVTLYNLALSVAGITSGVDSPSEASPEAEQCRLWFEPVRNLILRAAFWPSVKGVKRLGLLATRDTDKDWTSSDPFPGWLYAYALPSDALAPRFITDWQQFTTGIYEGKRAVFTNVENAVLVYTLRQADISLWDAGLFMAVAYGLAGHISMPLNGKPQRAQMNIQQANQMIIDARVNIANEEETAVDSLPEWISARGFQGTPSGNRYFHPYGPLLSSTGAPLV